MHLTPSLRKASELGLALTAVATLILAGCGGGGGSSSPNTGGTTPAVTTTTVTPFKGMFTGGNVSLVDANGIAVTLSAGGSINASGVASVTYPASVSYPLTVNVAGTYLDETSGVGATGTLSSGNPLQGLIPSSTEAMAASGVPVTAITHMARTMLPATGFSAASAVAAITGAASSVLGISSYSQAMLPPVFNAQGQTTDPATIKLAALANVIGQQGTGADLGANLQDIATKLAAGSAVTAVIPQATFDAALIAVNQIGGASGMVPAGMAIPTIPVFILPGGSLGNAISGGGNSGGGTVAPMPSITGFNPTMGAVGTSVTIMGTNLVLGFPPAPTVKFGATNAGGPYTNVSNTGITVTVPAGLAAGTHTITIGGMSGTPVTVGTFTVTTPVAAVPAVPTGLTATAVSSSQVDLNWTAAANATGYNVYRANAAYVATSLANKITATPITGTTYNDTGLTAGTTYFYRVAAVNTPAALQSMASIEASATPMLVGGGSTVAPGTLLGGAIQGTPLNLTTAVSTYAGSGSAVSGGTAPTDGVGVAASFSAPARITSDGINLYVADKLFIRQIVIATGAVITLAGNGSGGMLGAVDGTGVAASFSSATGITTDGSSLYVADRGARKIRKIVIATGEVTTLAGSGAASSLDGTGVAATFKAPADITTDGTNLYVLDDVSNSIRKIEIATGVVTTLAGSGANSTVDGIGIAASFWAPKGITTDGTNLYVTETMGAIRKVVIATGAVTTLAGPGTLFTSANGTGAAASFSGPQGITTDGTNLYVAEATGNKIRKIVIATAVVTTLAGSGTGAVVDATGVAASVFAPSGITTDGSSLYVSETGSRKIRKIQ